MDRPTRATRVFGALAALVVALASVACGDDGATDDAPQGFVATFSDQCTEVDRAIEGLPEPVGFASLADIATKAAMITEEGVADLRAVQPPPDASASVDELVDGLAAQGERFDALATAAEREAAAEVASLNEEGERQQRELGALADELGLDCGLAGEKGSGGGAPSFSAPPVLDGATAGSPTVIPEYGDDPALDALARECAAGDAESCDLLGLAGPPGSGYEEYGTTCGGRNESLADDPGTFCVDRY